MATRMADIPYSMSLLAHSRPPALEARKGQSPLNQGTEPPIPIPCDKRDCSMRYIKFVRPSTAGMQRAAPSMSTGVKKEAGNKEEKHEEPGKREEKKE